MFPGASTGPHARRGGGAIGSTISRSDSGDAR